MRKIAVTASASGSGKSTVGRALAERLGVPYVELDALVHGPNWTETPDDELRRILEPMLAGEGWVIDGGYRGKIGDLVLRAGRRRRVDRSPDPRLVSPPDPAHGAPHGATTRSCGTATASRCATRSAAGTR